MCRSLNCKHSHWDLVRLEEATLKTLQSNQALCYVNFNQCKNCIQLLSLTRQVGEYAFSKPTKPFIFSNY
jgi:hypothetical protein